MQGTETQTSEFFKSKIFGHPAGLFVLFFSQKMWETVSHSTECGVFIDQFLDLPLNQ